ncbi:MAG: hypothetical protein HOF69_02155 [Campylobacteraceae bacterium]|jgi:hypothetical protein|nr:hypothetical protein [Campylobacteraceae bacterium]MBT3882048.1 hypothetical protein [Campylobacteraceae bacterium]MBT4030057.1 hypothetical protein [Campylobacteraceae bacterium]MBT4179586.1 hypothetical protein [Campylobacteraceae bacterium]MBT4572814.1 hypothetical protein [Campylobacteraceae bacterium]
MKNILKSTLISLLLCTSHLVASDAKMQQQNLTAEQMQKQKKTIIDLASKEFSKNTPIKIDNYTTFTGVHGTPSSLVWNFDINTGAKSDKAIQEEDHSRMESAVTTGVCEKSKRFFDAQIDISYIYYSSKTKVKLFQFDITYDKCLESFRNNKKYY